MPVKIVVPSFGESITEGTVAQWLKKEGELVQRDDILLEVESEKATQGIPAPASGVLHITAKDGAKVEVGAVLGAIDEAGGAHAASMPAKESEEFKAGADRGAGDEAGAAAASAKPAIEPGQPARSLTAAPSPAPRGPGAPARDKKELAPSQPQTPPAAHDREQRVPMSAIRQRIAERLLTAKNATASLTTFNEIDMSAVMEVRARYKDKFKEKHGVSLGFMSFFVKASIEALRAFPLVNAALDGRDIVYHNMYDIGVAVSSDKGLMVPVLRDADRMTFGQIESTLSDLAARARAGTISVADLQGGTFTITNGGVFGSMLSTPILNYPQAAILGMHAIQKRPVVHEDQIVIRPIMYLALTYDHRLIDGREAVQFLVRVKEGIEDPQRLLLEI